MTPNGVATLLGRLSFLWPDARPLDENQELFKTWLMALKPVEDDEVFEALPALAQTIARRPSMAELIQAAKGVRAGRPTLALPVTTQRISPYGEAWQAIGKAVMDHRFPRAEMQVLIDKHKLWFDRFGSDIPATAEMVAEVQAMAAKANGVPVQPASGETTRPKFQSRYSDAHRARYMANVAAKEAAEKAEPA